MSIPQEQETNHPTRRDFCAVACRAASLAAAGAVFGACGGSSPTSPGNVPQMTTVNGTVSGQTVTVATAGGPLASVGGAALINSSLGMFLAFRASDTAINVLTAICTHEACTVTGFESSQYVCPCHGSRYSTAGSVINGPAPLPLHQFTSAFANGTLTFTT
jgi:Rieske Fe-S protein